VVGQAQKELIMIDEYLLLNSRFEKLEPPTEPPCDCPNADNFSFSWGGDFNVALSNLALLEAVRLRDVAITTWYNTQKDLIKDHINDKLSKSFGNFDDAKNEWFKNSEIKNINKYTPPLRTKYVKSYNSGGLRNYDYLNELKSLQLREVEISAGNIHNSQFGFLEVNGIALKDIIGLNTISQLRNTIEGAFGDNTWRTYEYKYIKQRLDFLGSGFEQELLDLKNNYYNSFSDWDRLGLMQFLLNYEYYKEIVNSGVLALPYELQKFGGSDMATPTIIEDYAKNNRGGDVSLFDPRYPERNRFVYQDNFCGGAIDYQLWEQHKTEALDKLVNDTSTIRLKITNLIKELGIDVQAQKDWLYTHSAEGIKIMEFLDINRVNGVASLDAISFSKNFIENIINEMPNAKFERFKELSELIKNDPFALIKDCIQQKGLNITSYRELFSHKLPNIAKIRLNTLGDGFKDQPLEEGNAAVANVDYYSVEVTTNPDLNNDGVPDTDMEVYNGYRTNFASLASGSKDDFQFSCNIPFNSSNTADVNWEFIPYSQNDINIWNSTNPLAAIFKIDAGSSVTFGSLISDDGAIIISKYSTNYWIGSTIQTPFSNSQPFSGNRQWGYIRNNNGKLELFARAVDVARISDRVLKLTPGTNECKEDTYYNIGEATWTNLQNAIKDWINNNGGQAKVIPKTAIRFDKSKLKEMLESNEAIDQINCN